MRRVLQAAWLQLIFFCGSSTGQELLSLHDWLASLRVEFPTGTYTFQLPHLPGALSVDVLKGYCQHQQLRDVVLDEVQGNSSYFSSAFALLDFGVTCHLETVTSINGSGIGTGQLDFDFSLQDASLRLAFQMFMSNNKSRPLPKRFALTNCALNTTVHYSYTGRTLAGKAIASLLDLAEPFIDAPEVVETGICTALAAANGASETLLGELWALAEEHQVFEPSRPLDLMPVSDEASNLREMLVTGNVGHVIQSIFHKGRLDISDPDLAVLADLSESLPGILAHWTKEPFSLSDLLAAGITVQTDLGQLGLSLSFPNCSTPGLPSPLLAANVSDTAIEASLFPVTGGCSLSLELNVTTANGAVQSGGVLKLPMELTGQLQRLHLAGGLQLGMRSDRMVQTLNVDQFAHVGCLATVLDSHNSSVNASVQLLSASGGLEGLELKMASSDALLHNMLDAMARSATAMAAPLLPGLVLALQGSGGALLRDSLNARLNASLTAPPVCPASTFESADQPALAFVGGTWAGALFALAGVSSLFVIAGLLSRWFAKLEAAERARPGSLALVERHQQDAEAPVVEQSQASPLPLAFHAAIWKSESATVTTAAVGVAGLWLFTLTSLFLRVAFSAVDTDPASGPGSQSLTNILDLNYPKLAGLLYEEGFWELTILIVVMSFCVPVLRALLFLTTWFLPPRLLSPKLRGQALEYNAMFQKLSLAETFMIALLIMPMYCMDWQTATNVGGTSTFVFGVEPHAGYFAFTTLSLIIMGLGEAVMRLDKRGRAWDERKVGVTHLALGDPGLQSSEAEGAASHAPLCVASSASPAIRVATWLALLASPALTVCGLALPAMSVTYYGVVGALRYLVAVPQQKSWSVVEIVAQFPWPAEPSVVLRLGVGIIVLTMTWFVLLAPLLHNLMMLVMWAAPLNRALRKRAESLMYVSFFWHALDVFVLMLFFMVFLGDYMFSVLGAVIRDHSTSGFLCATVEEQTAIRCIDFKIDGLSGAYVLLSAVVMQYSALLLLRHSLRAS